MRCNGGNAGSSVDEASGYTRGWHAMTMPMLTDRDSLLRNLHELRSEHRDLDTVIARLSIQPMDQLQVQRLKKRKLMLKDEISRLESRLIPDNIA